MTYHIKPAPRLSGSILYTLISVFSLTLITACGGGGLKLDANLNITDGRLATLCRINPFVTACADFADERKSFIDSCVAEDETVSDELCDTATTFVCTDNPFPILCDKEEKYRVEQQVIVDACEAGTCDDTQIVQFCEDNPYHARCIGEAAYDTTRDAILATCGTATIHEHCHTAVVPVCMDNPFDIVCYAGTTYEDARVSAIATCSGGFVAITNQRCVNAIAVTCVGDGIAANPGLCEEDSTVSTACGLNFFNTVCDNSENYLQERREFCANPATAGDDRCPAVVTSTCTITPSTDANNDNSTGNPFDTLCGTTYEASRNTIITACTTDLRGRLCTNATTFACTANPFHALCYDPTDTEFQTARSTAVTNCGDGTTTITEQICADAAVQACEGDGVDIFNALCVAYSGQSAQATACSDNDDDTPCYLAEQINACADGTETVRCTEVSTGDISTCAADPFAAACVADGSTFAPYLTAAQGIRYEYCGETGRSATDTLCTSYRACNTAFNSDSIQVPAGCGDNFDTAVRDTCAANPFDPVCTATIYNDDKVAFCSINTPASGGDPAVNNLFNPNCTADYQDATARSTFCAADPFHASCNNNTDFANSYANAREDICAGDTPHDSCLNTSLLEAAGHPTGPTVLATPPKYKDSFMTTTIAQDNAIAPLLGPLFTAEVTETVPVADDAPEDAQPTTRIVSAEISVPSVDIGPIVVGRRGGAGTKSNPNDNDDGWAYFTLTRPRLSGDTDSIASTRTSRHVTILPTTNLGAPLTAAPANAVWPGHFSTTATTTQTPVDFYIDFATRRVGFSSPTTVGVGHHIDVGKQRAENRPGIAIAEKIRIDVQFDPQGRLYGFIEINDDDEEARDALIVNGLIGQEGLVAVGYSNRNKGGAGGFTASNPLHRHYVEAVVPIDPTAGVASDPDSNGSLVNYEDWIESAVGPKYDRTAPRQSEFLQTNNRRIPGLVNAQNAVVTDFNNATHFRSGLLRGDAKNGFAVLGESDNFYAGVLNTADLGAPITQTQGSATWRGYLFAADSIGTIGRQFDLTVTFSSNHEGQVGTLSGLVVNDRSSVTRSATLYTIEGRFNARGVISGSIIRSLEINKAQQTITAPLSGIIGQTGAIGVFASNDERRKFAGGFVAVPNALTTVNYAGVWLGSHKAGVYGLFEAPIRQNHWLEGGIAGSAGGVNGQSRANIDPNSLNGEGNAGIIRLSDATWNRVPLGGSAGNGVAFYSGIITGTGRRTFYSGLFAQTDLGKPLTQTSGGLVWAGRLDVLQGGPGGQAIAGRRSGDIVLHVNFNNDGGTLTSTFAPSAITSPGQHYAINGSFNRDGFVSGNVTTHNGTGFLSGLIGQHGAVAAIVGGNMAGGFVAHAGVPAGFNAWPAARTYRGETPVPGFNTARQRIGHFVTAQTYDDWAYYTGQRYGQLRSVPHNESGQHNAFLHTDPADGNNIPWGNIGQDGAGEHTGRDAIGVGAGFEAAGLTAPAALRGGFSWLAGFWDKASTEIPVASNPLNRGYHAGLFQDTNVGRPLGRNSIQSGSTTAYWSGYFYAHQNETFKNSVNTFGRVNFLVNYGDARRITITYDSANGTRIGGIYAIEGLDRNGGLQWDERGVITGIISHKDAHVPEGRVTGLIGEAGMIAAFVSRADSGTKPHYGFTGGWVACPLTSRQGVCIP